MGSSIDEYLLRELKEAFKEFDRDNNGYIDRREFGELVASLESGMTSEEIEVGFSEVDRNRNGRIEFEEFFAWWQER